MLQFANFQDKESAKKIFNTTLEQLELTDVILANGNIVKVPVFVSDACQRILDNVKTEGLFRKAGSAARQREIRVSFIKLKFLFKLKTLISYEF